MWAPAVLTTIAITTAGFMYSVNHFSFKDSTEALIENFSVANISAFVLCVARYLSSEFILVPIGRSIICRKTSNRESKIAKFASCAFKCAFFVVMGSFEYALLSEQDFTPTWLFGTGSTANCWKENYEMPIELTQLFMVSLGYHLHSTIYHCCILERRSDFGEMLLHHALTLWLMVLSYLEGFSRIGLLIVFLNDVPDIFVYLTKSLGDTVFVKTSIVSYGFLVMAYFYFRLVVFPISVLPSLLYESRMDLVALVLYAGFLIALFLLHAYWFSLLVRIGINIATTGSRRDLIVDRKLE